jgi:hypothetical protein
LRKTAQNHDNGIAPKMAVFRGAGAICKAMQNCANAGFAISSRVPSTGLSHPSFCVALLSGGNAHYGVPGRICKPEGGNGFAQAFLKLCCR